MLVPSDFPLRAFRPSPYPKQCSPCLPIQPPLAGGGCKCREFQLGTWSVGFIYLCIYFSSWLCCPLRFQNSPQTDQWECFLVFGNFSPFKTLSLGWISIPTSFSLFLSFIFCPTSFRRQWAAFLGAWCPLPAFRSCFVEFAQRSNVLSMNLWWRKWSAHPIPLPS